MPAADLIRPGVVRQERRAVGGVLRQQVPRDGVALYEARDAVRVVALLDGEARHQAERAESNVFLRLESTEGRGADDVHLIPRYPLLVEDDATSGAVVAHGQVE